MTDADIEHKIKSEVGCLAIFVIVFFFVACVALTYSLVNKDEVISIKSRLDTIEGKHKE